MDLTSPLDFSGSLDPPYVFDPLEPTHDLGVPPEVRGSILVDSVHDGHVIPPAFCHHPQIPPDLLEARFIEERDWGAARVARHLAAALGLPGTHRVRIARVLLDFNRFPGSTPPSNRDPLERLAINPPFSLALDHTLKMQLLDIYDQISEHMDRALQTCQLKVGIHTYDEHNPSRTRRPDVSLINQPAHYAREFCMPYGVFDPLYPDPLAESSCSRVLKDRLALDLERAGYRVGHNYPYLLPEGSIEVRTQVWYFFHYLKRRFTYEHPETVGQPSYDMVWNMLLNTNLRLQESENLRGFIHRFRKVPTADLARYRDAQAAYARVGAFLHDSSCTTDYRAWHHRPSSLVIEVRKDLVCDLDPHTRRPLRPRDDAARQIGETLARAVATYFTTDRPAELGHTRHTP